jgi:hypothetical protein
MERIKKHRSHIKGRFKCRPFGKYKKKIQREEFNEWLEKRNMKTKEKKNGK